MGGPLGRIDDLRKRLDREPGSRVFAQLAEELRKDGQLVEAVHACRLGLRQHPAYASARMTLGRALVESGDLVSAKGEFERVLEAAPDNILAGRLLAEVLEGLGETGAARERYELTLHLAPDDTQLRARLEALVRTSAGSAAGETSKEPRVVDSAVPRPRAQAVVAAAMAADARRDGEVTAETIPFQDKLTVTRERSRPEWSEGRPAAVTDGELPRESPSASGIAAGESDAVGLPGSEPAPASLAAEGRGQTEEPDVAAALAMARTEVSPRGGVAFPAGTLPVGTPRPDLSAAESPSELRTTPFRAEALRMAAERSEAETGVQRPDAELATPTLAELYLTQGHPEKAVDVYGRVLERNPDNVEARARLAEIRLEIEATASARLGRPVGLQMAIDRLEAFLAQVQARAR